MATRRRRPTARSRRRLLNEAHTDLQNVVLLLRGDLKGSREGKHLAAEAVQRLLDRAEAAEAALSMALAGHVGLSDHTVKRRPSATTRGRR